jgi:MtN3 and saliva related transmembrane protein
LNPVTAIGIAASTFTSLTLLPQLIKIVRERDAEGTSYLMLVVLFIGLSLWIVYGVLKDDLIIIVANSVSLLINILTGVFTFIHRRAPRGPQKD